MKTEDKTPNVAAFEAELIQLLRRHGLMLAPSMYDALEVWPLRDSEDPLPRGIDDKTALSTKLSRPQGPL